MRVSSFSRISSLTISLVSLLFLFFLIWSNAKLAKLSQQQQIFQEIKQEIQVGVVTALSNYLQSGDTLQLNAAADLLKSTEEKLDSLQLSQIKPLRQAIVSMQERLTQDYRAIGKLAGEQDGLVLNAERSLSNEISSLFDYAIAGYATQPEAATSYLASANDLMLQLTQLIHERQQLGNGGAKHNIQAVLNSLDDSVEAIEKLPLLGIMEQLPDQSMMLVQRQASDLGEKIINELTSLIKRYPRELERTQKLVLQRTQAFSQIKADMQTLQQRSLAAERALEAREQDTVNQIKWFVVALVALLVLFALLNFVLLKRMIVSPVRRLRDAMRSLVKEGEMESLPGATRRTEMGEIAMSFNELLATNSDEEKRKKEQMKVVERALSTIVREIQQVSKSSEASSQSAEENREQLQQLAELSEKLVQRFDVLGQNAQATRQSVKHSESDTNALEQTIARAQELIETGTLGVKELTTSVTEVNHILTVISSIAEQTNLLALNAAIEAARAGQHGRGFAVVADEVRKLAKQTNQSLSEVQQILRRLTDASTSLDENYSLIQASATEQREKVHSLTRALDEMGQKALSSSDQVDTAFHLVSSQSTHVNRFEETMQQLADTLNGSVTLLEKVQRQADQQQQKIEQVFGH